MKNIFKSLLTNRSENTKKDSITCEPGKPIFFHGDSPGPLVFLGSPERLAFHSAIDFFQEKRNQFPERYQDPTKIGFLTSFSQQGMEGGAFLVVHSIEDSKENAFLGSYNYLYPETEIAIFSKNVELEFEGKLLDVFERLISGEFKNCLIGLKMEKHRYGGKPIKL